MGKYCLSYRSDVSILNNSRAITLIHTVRIHHKLFVTSPQLMCISYLKQIGLQLSTVEGTKEIYAIINCLVILISRLINVS